MIGSVTLVQLFTSGVDGDADCIVNVHVVKPSLQNKKYGNICKRLNSYQNDRWKPITTISTKKKERKS